MLFYFEKLIAYLYFYLKLILQKIMKYQEELDKIINHLCENKKNTFYPDEIRKHIFNSEVDINMAEYFINELISKDVVGHYKDRSIHYVQKTQIFKDNGGYKQIVINEQNDQNSLEENKKLTDEINKLTIENLRLQNIDLRRKTIYVISGFVGGIIIMLIERYFFKC